MGFLLFSLPHFLGNGGGGYEVLFGWYLVGYLSCSIICLPASFPSLTMNLSAAASWLCGSSSSQVWWLTQPWDLAELRGCENCFVFKETSGAQPTVLVVLGEKQPDRLGRGGVVPRTRTRKREEESGRRHLGKLKGSVDLGHFGAGCFASLSLGRFPRL